MHRVCSVCGESKPTAAFRRSFKSPDGYHTYCKQCGPPKTAPANAQHFMPDQRVRSGLTSTCRGCLNARCRQRPPQPYVRTKPYDPVFLAREEAKASGMLRCPRCERVLPASPEFWYRDSSSPTGFQHKCRLCEQTAKRLAESQADPWRPFERASKHLRSVLRSAVRLRDDLLKERQAVHDAALTSEGLRVCSRCGIAYPNDRVFFWNGSPECKLCGRSRMNRRNWANGRSPRRLLTPAERAAAEALQTRVSNQRRRAKMRQADGRHTAADVRRILREQDGRCAYCGCDLSGGFHEDHKVPLARGGSNWPQNICCACPDCNVAKGTMTDVEFREARSRPLDKRFTPE